jgi:heptose-I-phosphate ethanolaminephosphotransferase
VFSLENGNFTNVTREQSPEKELYIVVIGESTSRNHLSLYNYHINTNPLLSEMKDKLLIYDNVISPHAQTIKSLEKVLTLGNYENIEYTYDGTIVQLLNSVGFNTYWISNQKAKGKYETLVYKISKPTKQQIFINKSQNKNISYDGDLLAPLKKIVAKNEIKQFIFIHLIGSHVSYSKRYPEKFKIFKSNKKSSKKQKIIDEYDNSILYNDYVINSIINTVKDTHKSSFVIYFSDHGEDVFDTSEQLLMHNESIGTKPMFDIPFIVFLSDSFKKYNSTIFINENRPYMTDDLIYSISDLLKINFDQNETTRSIFSKSFNEDRERIILKRINYDMKFHSSYSKP